MRILCVWMKGHATQGRDALGTHNVHEAQCPDAVRGQLGYPPAQACIAGSHGWLLAPHSSCEPARMVHKGWLDGAEGRAGATHRA
jgi:hypothetical protein